MTKISQTNTEIFPQNNMKCYDLCKSNVKSQRKAKKPNRKKNSENKYNTYNNNKFIKLKHEHWFVVGIQTYTPSSLFPTQTLMAKYSALKWLKVIKKRSHTKTDKKAINTLSTPSRDSKA